MYKAANLKKKIYIIGSAGIPARYGGFETFAEQIARELAGGFEIFVCCSQKFYDPGERTTLWHGINRLFLRWYPNGICSILYDLAGICKSRKSADIILLLGAGASMLLTFFPRSIRKKIWLHIDGVEWRRKKWNLVTRAFLYLNFAIGIRKAGKILIDNEELKYLIPKRLQTKSILIHYGGDHLKFISVPSPFPFPYALMISRSVPENNPELIINAFLTLKDLTLVIISDWNKTAYGRDLFARYSLNHGLILLDPIYDTEALQKYRSNCSVYIHGHSAGGTNPSLVEAMFSAIPVIAFDNVFNRRTTNGLAYYFRTAEELCTILQNRDAVEMLKKAEALRAFAEKNNCWHKAADIINSNIAASLNSV